MSKITELESHLKQSPRRWLVTGGAGFIGGHIAERLLSLGQNVLVLDNISTGSERLIQDFQEKFPTQFSFEKIDIADRPAVRNLFKSFRPEYVIHHAAIASVPASIKDPERSHRANVDGFLSVLDSAREFPVSKFVYASSSAVYGDLPGLPKTEAHPTEPLSPYAAHKKMNEESASVYSKLYQVPCVGFRYFNVYGPRQDPRGPYAAVISLWVKALLNQQALKIFGKGKQTRDFVNVADVVDANLLAALSSNEIQGRVYNIGRGQPVSLLELASHLQQILKELRPELQFFPAQFLESRTGDIEFSYCDPRLAEYDLGFRAKVDLPMGLRETIKDFLKNENSGVLSRDSF